MKINDVYTQVAGLASRVIAGKAVIVHPDQNRIVSLNDTGTEIWSRLGQKSIEEIVNELCSVYDVAKDVLQRDTMEHLEQLVLAGLIEQVER